MFGSVEDSLTAGYDFKQMFGDRRCQDVLSGGGRRVSLTLADRCIAMPPCIECQMLMMLTMLTTRRHMRSVW